MRCLTTLAVAKDYVVWVIDEDANEALVEWYWQGRNRSTWRNNLPGANMYTAIPTLALLRLNHGFRDEKPVPNAWAHGTADKKSATSGEERVLVLVIGGGTLGRVCWICQRNGRPWSTMVWEMSCANIVGVKAILEYLQNGSKYIFFKLLRLCSKIGYHRRCIWGE